MSVYLAQKRENDAMEKTGQHVVSIDGKEQTGPNFETLMRREQIAAQIVAIMQAHFTRPGPQEMKEILVCAETQVTALERQQTLHPS